VEDFVDNITRGNPGSVKTVLASVVFALMAYQLVLAAIGYRKLPVMAAKPAFFTHRASGDMLVVLVTVVAVMCVAAFGLDDDYAAHVIAGIGLAVALAAKVSVVRFFPRAGGLLPYLGVTVFVLLAVTWFTAVPDFLSGDD
jgi:Family of unknown function (DUF6529)